MSDILLNYINNSIHLSKTVSNIELDFKNGALFCELIEKALNFKSLNYNLIPKTYSEILENFEILKKNLKLIGIGINNFIINEIIEGKTAAAAKLIYKIKIEGHRKKINFNNIISKIHKNDFDWEREKNNISEIKLLSDKSKLENKFPISPSVSSSEKLPTFSNFSNKKYKNEKTKKIIKNKELNGFYKINPITDKNNIGKNKEKFSFPKLKPTKISNFFNSTFQSLLNNKIDNREQTQESKLIEINEEEKDKNKDNETFNENYYLSTGFSDKKMKKTKSLFEYDRILNSMKSNVLNRTSKKGNFERLNSDNLIKYSSFYVNTKKIGFNMDEVSPNLKNHGIIYKNEFYFSPKNMVKDLKKFLSSKTDRKIKNIISPSIKNSILNEQKILIEKSMLNKVNNESKLFKNRFNKNSSIYKRLEYSKKYDEQFYNINRQKINQKFFSYDKKKIETPIEEFEQFDADYCLSTLNDSKTNSKSKIDIEKYYKKNKNKNYEQMKEMTNLIIELTELCYKSQHKLKEELIDIQEFREWIDLFIEGKSCIKIPIKKRKPQNNNIASVEIINKTNIKENILNDELINTEFIDYLYFRGNWDINHFVEKELYGKQINIIDILGNDSFNIIHNANNLVQNSKTSNPGMKFSNNDFELTEEELNNISIPEKIIFNNLLGEIILLNYDNAFYDCENSNSKLNIKTFDIKEKANNIQDESLNKNDYINFDYIPIKICFYGHPFCGRKTQAKLINEKYNNIKIYSINDITQFYLDEYKRLNLSKEQNIKTNKSSKKNNLNENKDLEDKEKYKHIFSLIENSLNDKYVINDLTPENILDEVKIKLLIHQIKKDFPMEIQEKIKEKIQKKRILEKELKIMNKQNNDFVSNETNSSIINKKESKNSIKNNNLKNINLQNKIEEIEKLKIDLLEGFILYDYPTTFIQMMKLENIITGYIQPIDKNIDQREYKINNLLNTIDRPYINLSNIKEYISSDLNINNLNLQKSFFNSYFLIELSEEETLKRMKNRFKDPNTGIIYHSEYFPPNPDDKKLNERLIELKEPNEDKIKELLKQFYLEYPKVLYQINLFNNYYRVDALEKNEVFEIIEKYILNEFKKFEEEENNDIIGNLIDENNKSEINEKSDVIKYIKRLKEIKKILPEEFSEDFIKNWTEIQDKYIREIKNFIKFFFKTRNNILEQMNFYREDFIEILNNTSQKYKLVEVLYEKYNILFQKFPYLKSNNLVKEEFNNNIIELSGNLWNLVQERKLSSITELNNIKNQNFIEQNLESFGNYIINLIILETQYYYNKINLIKKFYYEFEKPKLSEKFPYEYIFNEESILENTFTSPIFIHRSSENKEEEYKISPKLDKIYLNCFKLLFDYDKKVLLIKNKLKDEYNNMYNIDDIRMSLARSRKKLKSIKKKTLRESTNQENKNIIINDLEELNLALNNEKIKYKMKIIFLKKFGEKNLEEIYNIGKKTFDELDKYIIDSVNSQNNAVNELILKIKKNIKEGATKLNYKDVELDAFNIYEINSLNFNQFNIDSLNIIPEEEKRIDYKELHEVYLDIKKFEIQDNYVSLNNFIDIAFKKYLFEKKSKAFMEYFQKIPFFYLYNFINKFAIKKYKGYSLIKLNEIFTILGLLNKTPPKKEQQNDIMRNINNKLKYKIFLSKDDFINNSLWFEKNDKSINLKHSESKRDSKIPKKAKSPSIFELSNNFNIPKEKKIKYRGTRVFSKMKFNLNNSKDIKVISEEEQLKEYLFNINKTKDNFIDFINFMKIIVINKNSGKKKVKGFLSNLNDFKSNLDNDEILSMNSFVESFDKAQINELKEVKKSSICNDKKIIKFEKNNKILKNTKNNEGNVNASEDKINNFFDYSYFDYLIKI